MTVTLSKTYSAVNAKNIAGTPEAGVTASVVRITC